MKILLIYPADKHTIRTNVPPFVDQGIGVYPPLGLLYLASAIMRWSDWEVEILDCNAEGIDYQVLRDEIKKRKPDVVGIQAITFTLIDVIMTAKTVKDINPQIPLRQDDRGRLQAATPWGRIRLPPDTICTI